jgi:hypothetical protein
MPQEMAQTILTLSQAGWQADEAEMNERFSMKLKRAVESGGRRVEGQNGENGQATQEAL